MADKLTPKELTGKSPEQLEKILAERREKLRHLRFQVFSKEVKNIREIRFVRREIARILTHLNALDKGHAKPKAVSESSTK